jgi:hypothetical protein
MSRLAPFVAALLFALAARPSSATEVPSDHDLLPEGISGEQAKRVRSDAIRRAHVWQKPRVPIEEADLLTGNDPFLQLNDQVTCDYVDWPLGGSVPKFLCRLESGEIVKIKFGDPDEASTREIPAEVAASRLLRVLGFGADRMDMVRRVNCRGCAGVWEEECRRGQSRPGESASRGRRSRRCVAPPGDVVSFDWVSVERLMEGRTLQGGRDEGWSWRDDLARVDTSLTDSSNQAELDAFRLIITFIESVDTKSGNQRLVCLPGGASDQNHNLCARPFMIMHDLGATFGKPGALSVSGAKFKLGGWQRQEVWKEKGSCTTNPDHGRKYTFDPYPISEEGRQFLASLLNRLSLRQIKDLFRGVHADMWPDQGTEELSVDELVGRSLRYRSEAELLKVFDVSAAMTRATGSNDAELTIQGIEDARLRAELRLLAWTTVFEEKRSAVTRQRCGRQWGSTPRSSN